MSTRRSQSVPQRAGTRTQFLTALERRPSAGSRAFEAAARRAWDDEHLSEALASSVVITARVAGRQVDLSPRALADIDPMALEEVRRPASFTDRMHRTTLMVIKTLTPFSMWAESLNEGNHTLDLTVGRPKAQLVSQVLRLSWSTELLELEHYPDFVWWEGGDRLLVDVTSGRQLKPSQTLMWELTARLCEQLGWGFEVRGPMSSQRALNLHAVDFCADVNATTVTLAERIFEAVPEKRSLHRIVTEFGGDDLGRHGSPLHAALHLIANGLLFCDLDLPLRASRWLSRDPEMASSDPTTIARSRWLRDLTRPSLLEVN